MIKSHPGIIYDVVMWTVGNLENYYGENPKNGL